MKPNYTIVSTIALLSGSLWGQTVDFVRDVRPLWEKHCYACHSGDKQESVFVWMYAKKRFEVGIELGLILSLFIQNGVHLSSW